MHTADCAVSTGATADGELIVITWLLQPAIDAVIVTFVPIAMPVMAVAPTVPAVAVMVAPAGLVKLMLYVVPLQIPAENEAAGVAHGVVQSAGLVTFTTEVHAPDVAVRVTLVPMAIPVTVVPLTVPALAVKVAPAVAENATE